MERQFKIRGLKEKMYRIKKEIENTISYLEELSDDASLPRCARCGYSNLRKRKNNTYFCNSCGFDSFTLKIEAKNEGEGK